MAENEDLALAHEAGELICVLRAMAQGFARFLAITDVFHIIRCSKNQSKELLELMKKKEKKTKKKAKGRRPRLRRANKEARKEQEKKEREEKKKAEEKKEEEKEAGEPENEAINAILIVV
ncbi:hypothetical protein BDV36DRAFT_294809 [Aspergillus pseudocaelatus]|uniref:Uncharacterized protein n=1 Tax=Aspergillus pseudocaelatus TaxID=1825620 RepID=A0ABQ6WNS9_9EURO|nr:hypothetical protein BDV36DRAFT_294809 [Aspergillus pseudocaelatus]